eukprot:TRINITY_DN943_c0_g1_i1.p2 TRINITY_DN943_c0_g1~~TRINITY_DN943_c0_g1_i1.p2  ORF type:complete len:232 (-),score=49.04 TRINITY_DN943_c0_g1_i1:298-993(-)
MKLFLVVLVAASVCMGVCGKSSAPDLPAEVQVSGSPSIYLQKKAVIEIMRTQCEKFFPHRVCFPDKILDAKTGRDGTDKLISVAFKACCYNPGSGSVSNSFLVQGVYRTNPGFINLGVTDSEAKLTHDSCPALSPLNTLKKGDDIADVVLKRLDTLESHNSFASGLSRQFSGFESNSKLYLGKFGGRQFDGFSIKMDVRGKLDFAGTKFEDFKLAASVVKGDDRLEVLCVV